MTYDEAKQYCHVRSAIYRESLACPYTHPDPEIRFQRFQAVNKVAGDLMVKGEIVFSPISHGHPIAEVTDLPRNWGFWAAIAGP